MTDGQRSSLASPVKATGDAKGSNLGEDLIFLSYAEEDTAAAQQVAQEFSSRGLKVYDWRNDENRGERFIERIETNLKQADAFVALASANFLASPWCRRERELAMLREIRRPNGSAEPGFLHVVKVGELPFEEAGFLEAYDWVGMDNIVQLAEKLAKMTRLPVAKPDVRSPAKARATVPALSAAQYGASLFRNRHEELERVRNALTNSAGQHFWLVIAPPQLGKTWFLDRISAVLALEESDNPWTTKLVDLREYPRDRLGDAGLLLAQLFGKRLPVRLDDGNLARMAAEIIESGRPHLCLLDSAELLEKNTASKLRSALGQIRAYIQEGGQPTARLAVIVATRRDEAWRGIIPQPAPEALPLTEFKVNIVEEALRNLAKQMGRNFEDATYKKYARHVHKLTEGLPALLVNCLEWIQRRQWAGMNLLARDETFTTLAQPYVEQRLLSNGGLFPGTYGEVERDSRVLREAFRVLSPYRLFTLSHVRYHLDRDDPLKAAMADSGWAMEDLWEHISGTALLRRPLPEVWQELQGAIRRLLYRYYHRSPDTRLKAHHEARELVASWTLGQTGKDQLVGVTEWLWHEANVQNLSTSGVEDQLFDSLRSFCASLSKSSYSVQEVRQFVEIVIYKDDELISLINNNAVLDELVDIVVSLGR